MSHVSRLAKLRAMSPREVASRSAYVAFTAWERRQHSQGKLSRPGRLRDGLRPEIRRRDDWQAVLASRTHGGSFFDGVSAETRQLLLAHYPDEVARARAIGDAVARHEIAFFGTGYKFGERIAWHQDPVSSSEWPRLYHADVPMGDSRRYGDAKHVWELNRHQFLMDLAKAALLDGSGGHRAALEAIVLDWMQEVPYGTGAAWACALEPAFRAWSWLWAYEMLRVSGPLDQEFHLAWLTGFHDHGHFLYRHLETYTSPYNHLVGEASALWALGLLFPEFSEAPAWTARGREVLEGTLATQFHRDGGTVEQSTFYHHATLGFYMLSALLGRLNKTDLSPGVWAAVERGLEFSLTLVQPDGRVPAIGGADDGKPIRLEHLPFFDFRPYLAMGAVLCARGDLKYVAGRFWEDALWLLGPEGARQFAALESRLPARAVALPESGYFVARSAWSTDADYLCFDCGPQAAGLRRDDVPSAAHGHADCLSAVVWLGGRPVLVDPGFYCYNGDSDWEIYFRKTAAHSTITVDGRDQARHVHKMAWTRTYTPRFESFSAADPSGWARGSHDGFAQGGRGLVHRRSVWLRPGYLVICDELLGGEGQRATANFQFAPGALTLESGRARHDGRFEMWWARQGVAEPRIVDGGDTVDGGWIAPSLGVRTRAPRLQLDFTLAHSHEILLVVFADTTRCRVSAAGQAEAALVAEVSATGRWDDTIVAGREGTLVEAGGIATDAALAIVRADESGLEAYRIGGTSLRSDGRQAHGARQPAATR